VHGGTPAEDMALAYRAPHFIGSQGTFSWMVAYLSQGTSVHLPFLSSTCDGAVWLPWSKLFIHDDPRIRYYALEGPLQALTPDEVYPTLCPLRHKAELAGKESKTMQVLKGQTPFSQCVRARTAEGAPGTCENEG